MTFATPALLLLLPLATLPPLWRWLRARRQPALAVPELHVIREAARDVATWRLRLRALPELLRAAAVVMVIVALARPQEGLALTLLPEEGIDIVVALDVSSSMQQLTPDGETRLQAARDVVQDFVSGLEGDRVGLVIFQSRALALSPLTLDHKALNRTVRDVSSGLIPDGTAIGMGLAEALNLLRDSPARSRVVVLLTDGQNNSGEVDPLDAAQVARALDVRVYTIGFVRAGGALPGFGQGLDEVSLRRIAEVTDASYYNAATGAQLAQVYESIGQLERSRIGERRFTTFQEFAPWFAFAALTLLACEAALRATALRRYP
jgi:Ca-activated chloride channel family protein